MKIPNQLNRLLTRWYLRRQGVEWSGVLPQMDMLRPPQFTVLGRLKIGSGVKFLTRMDVRTIIKVDENITITDVRTVIQVDEGATIVVGNDVVFNNVLWIRAREQITIGDNALIGPVVTVRDAEWHPVYPAHVCKSRPVYLGRNCEIGTGTRITPGVSIGENSVVGEGSVVLQSFGPNLSIGGNPARVLRDHTDKYTDHPDWVRP